MALAGCAVPAIDAYQPTIQNAVAVRQADIPTLSVGKFSLAPGRPASMDKSITIRASNLRPPAGTSFSAFLGESLATELRSAGKLSPSADTVVEGELTDSKVSSAVGVGEAKLAATFRARRGTVVIYEKNLSVSAVWQSSFIGALAIPDAMNQYTGLYGKLVGALLQDEGFRQALRRPLP